MTVNVEGRHRVNNPNHNGIVGPDAPINEAISARR